MGGGPGSGIHKSVDGGETWKNYTKVFQMIKIQMETVKLIMMIFQPSIWENWFGNIPQKSDVLYAAIELEKNNRWAYKSEDRGDLGKMSNAVSGATGPHYYQELYASPHKFDRLYLMNVRVLHLRMVEKHLNN